MPQNKLKDFLRNGARNTKRKLKVFTRGMASDNTKGNAMVRNLKDYLIQPFFDDKRNLTV